MATLSLIAINGTWLETPASITWSEDDISAPGAGRTLDTIMHTKKIGSKIQLKLKWPVMTTEDASVLLKALSSEENFSVEYFDVKENGFVTKTFYSGNRSSAYAWILDDSKVVENVSCDITEV